MGIYEKATAVTAVGAGMYDAYISEQWTVGVKPQGGYLLGIVARAAADMVGDSHPHLQAISSSFLQAPDVGPATVQVDVLRAGRGASQLRATLLQNDKPCVDSLLVQGVLDDADAWWTAATPPDIPDESDCDLMPRSAPGAGFDVPMMDMVEQRFDPKGMGFTRGEPGHAGTIGGWIRLADGAAWDPMSLLIPLDPTPPISFDMGLAGWAPTMQLSAYIRRLPAPGPVRVFTKSLDIGNDRMDETTYAWDSKGRLVGQATQLTGVRTP
ncbi:thioesterase superfamily protein [Antricoccus suffuscus]|uniref:Thioesterase superfamily protein n=1 Tax=Antricoccus suffuscus TaxID=1629062 RepID=A0A2T1A2K8_9ACTN|nr:thioesterase family protein [Antricoccus suffuscus]PRZ42839.1 thioesterase superfamily protein [Antricoccus suffuscus]